MMMSRFSKYYIRILVSIIILNSLMMLTNLCQAQSVSKNEAKEQIVQWLKEGIELYRMRADGQTIISFYAEKQLGIPYKGGLLEKSGLESLVVTLEGSDCVIFVETTLALAMTTMLGNYSYELFERHLSLIRYRNGTIDGYVSRLHYFGDWMKDGQNKRLMRVLFQEERFPKLQAYSFMSSNRSSYPALADDNEAIEEMKKTEQRLNEDLLHYIPTDNIPDVLTDLQTGDIVAFVTKVPGLDFSHTAVIKKDGDRIGFWHASTTGSVIVEPKTLYDYTKDRSSLLGIVVARSNFIRN
jgi:hypothetical protein